MEKLFISKVFELSPTLKMNAKSGVIVISRPEDVFQPTKLHQCAVPAYIRVKWRADERLHSGSRLIQDTRGILL